MLVMMIPCANMHTHLHADNNGVQVQDWLPILAQNVQAHVPFQVDIGMVDLLCAFDFRGIVWEVLVDDEGEVEDATLVHAFVRLDGEGEIEDVVGIREGHFHGTPKREFLEIYRNMLDDCAQGELDTAILKVTYLVAPEAGLR